MRHRSPGERRCTYLVVLDRDSTPLSDLREFAAYLSALTVSDFDVVVVDASEPSALARHRCVLRWVSRHLVARPQHRDLAGGIDPIRAATEVAACDKVIVADAQVRCSEEALDQICALLDRHECVELRQYFDPLPWWGGIEAGRMLVHRGIGPLPDQRSTFAFRKSAVRQGTEMLAAVEVFVRRTAPPLDEWLRDRPIHADGDLAIPVKAAFFFGLLPIAVLLAMIGGVRLAEGYAGAIAFGSFVLALRGRIGAARFFPWPTCLYAPLWLLERSITIYWALFRKLSGPETRRVPISRPSGELIASGS